MSLSSLFSYMKEKKQDIDTTIQNDLSNKKALKAENIVENTVKDLGQQNMEKTKEQILSGKVKPEVAKQFVEETNNSNKLPSQDNTAINQKPNFNNLSNKTNTSTLETPKKGLEGIFGYLASKSGEGVDKGIFKNQKTLESQRKFEDNYKANEVKKLGKAGFNALTDFGNTLASQSGKASGQMVGNIFVPNTGVDWSSFPKNMQNREIIAANQAKAAQQAKEKDIDNAFKVADLKLKERGLDLEQEKINNKDRVKPTDKAVSADAINSIRAMQSEIYKNRDYYGRGLLDSTLRVAKNTLGTKGAQLDADISQRFKPVALDLLKNFKGAISEGEREFLMNFVQGADTSPKALIDTLNDVARKIAIQSGNEFSDFDYGQAQANNSEFKKVE